jgi:hypothetical protein
MPHVVEAIFGTHDPASVAEMLTQTVSSGLESMGSSDV